MYTVDASVWVNSFDKRESGHEMSRRFLDLLREQKLSVTVPNLVLVEVAGAISRTRSDPAQATAFATSLLRLANVSFIPLDSLHAQLAQDLAAKHGLRGADAVYAAVAKQTSTTLVTLDNEHLMRLDGIATTCTPKAIVDELTQISENKEESSTDEGQQVVDAPEEEDK